MDNPRPEKVAVVDEVRSKLSDAQAALLTEYRGLTVADMQTLRRSLRDAGGEVKIYKNTLVRFAARELGLEIDDLLTGPTAIAFVATEGGDPVTVAKALKDFAKANPALVVKGGVLGDKVLTAGETQALAEVEPREVLLAKLAGAMAAPMQQFAGLLQALPRNFAYGLSALIEKNGGAPQSSRSDSDAEGGAPRLSPSEGDAEGVAPQSSRSDSDAEGGAPQLSPSEGDAEGVAPQSAPVSEAPAAADAPEGEPTPEPQAVADAPVADAPEPQSEPETIEPAEAPEDAPASTEES